MATAPGGDDALLRSAIVNDLARGIAQQRTGTLASGRPLPPRVKRPRLTQLAMPGQMQRGPRPPMAIPSPGLVQ